MNLKLVYNINFGLQIQRLLPSYLKTLRFHVYWLKSLLQPLQELHYDFRIWSVAQRYESLNSSQSLLLSHNLNEIYDLVQRRIYIVNNYLNVSSAPSYHFTIKIPVGFDVEAIRKYVNNYVLADRTFDIEII
jgi:hypothetical protein